ncbi:MULTISPECIES: PP2C family protein-serine/threonine phosphatase [unclassified Streptomyces]|uniref:PP2C family protein-serine/threonine phosphatase n=1 Tax=unclassified Streptomyces TaxID=2593676 RepID=UPI00336A0A27
MPERAQAVLRLLREYATIAPTDLPEVLRREYESLQISHLTIYLADLQQKLLVSVPDSRVEAPRSVPIDGTLAGWAYRTASPRITEDAMGRGLVLWMPLLDGVERLGVVAIQAPAMDATTMETCRALVSLIALIVIDKGGYSDAYIARQRLGAMRIPSELVWAFLAPRTVGTDRFTSSAVLEPAYDLGGDAFDHSTLDHTVHLGIFDSMGHDLAAGLVASVALAACRASRRSGAGLEEVAVSIDEAVHEVFPDRYVTAVLASMQTGTGSLEWLNCGHPTPLLIRDKEVLREALVREPQPPLGLRNMQPRKSCQVGRFQMEPGDSVLLYTDGVTEARSPSGVRFGEERFADFIIRAMAAGDPAPEALRRLIHTILEHHGGELDDDATIVLTEWHPFPQTRSHPEA